MAKKRKVKKIIIKKGESIGNTFLPIQSNTTFLCVGTDRSTGDSLAPIVGTILKEKGFDVVGTIDEPCHAMNVTSLHEELLAKGKHVIAIDACLGEKESIGNIEVVYAPLRPGSGVDKDLGEVGEMYISGIVNISGFMEYFVLQNTRLSIVVEMAKAIVDLIERSYVKYYSEEEVTC